MFTVEQIKTAHSKVKSGADFPAKQIIQHFVTTAPNPALKNGLSGLEK